MNAPAEPGDYARERAAARAALVRLRKMPPDDPEYSGLRDYVVGEYMSYARYVAAKFRQRGESQADLEQVAYVGLVKAVDNPAPPRKDAASGVRVEAGVDSVARRGSFRT